MKHWDRLQQQALSSYGIVTFAQARDVNVFPAEIYRWCKSGKLMKLPHSEESLEEEDTTQGSQPVSLKMVFLNIYVLFLSQ